MAKKKDRLEKLQERWYANNISQKGISQITAKIEREIKMLEVVKVQPGKKVEIDPEFIKQEQNRFKMALMRLNRGR